MTTAGPHRRLIDGRYELLEPLEGAAAGAVVWRARETLLEKEVVLRELRPADSSPTGRAERDRWREQVLRRVQELMRLQHPSIAAVQCVVDSGEHPWLVTELVTGRSLAEQLSDGPLEVPEAAGIGRGILAGLRAAHGLGLHYGDLRPGNVLIRPDGTPVLSGFGIAALNDAAGTALAEPGYTAPDYLAPERLRSGEPGPSADLWALSMVLYVAVEGHHPYRRANDFATVAAVLQEPLPDPVRAGALAPLLAEALAKDPAQRPGIARFDRLLAVAQKARQADPRRSGPNVSMVKPGPTVHLNKHLAPEPQDAVPQDAPPSGRHPHEDRPKARGTKSDGPKARGAEKSPHRSDSERSAEMAALRKRREARLGKAAQENEKPAAKARTRRRVLVLSSVAVVLVTVAGVTVWSTGMFAPDAVDCRPGAVQSPAGAGLLTPQGVREVIASQQQQLNTIKALSLSVYSTHAESDVPTAANPHLYDQFSYSKGAGTHRPEGTVSSGDKPVDLNSVNWDCLPGLLQKAQDTLNVPHPTGRYIMLEGPDRFSDEPLISIYLSDAYGSGYLKADTSGHIQDTHRHG
ncbi:serine/threonine protein kinase [Kitasatospora azatica]|uniref:serine/threonine protein kinase n=1 Tax=Kitasatospora azatica TaxID=58347 RepID=UPI0018DCC6D8|nr:serine/threonine-protein kinase [Kitasatospora azatica]